MSNVGTPYSLKIASSGAERPDRPPPDARFGHADRDSGESAFCTTLPSIQSERAPRRRLRRRAPVCVRHVRRRRLSLWATPESGIPSVARRWSKRQTHIAHLGDGRQSAPREDLPTAASTRASSLSLTLEQPRRSSQPVSLPQTISSRKFVERSPFLARCRTIEQRPKPSVARQQQCLQIRFFADRQQHGARLSALGNQDRASPFQSLDHAAQIVLYFAQTLVFITQTPHLRSAAGRRAPLRS